MKQNNEILLAIASTCEHAEMTDGRIAPCLMARAGTGENQLPLILLRRAFNHVDDDAAKVTILNPWDSQGVHITDGTGIYPCVRGCGGGGYQQGYVLQHLRDNG